RDDDLDVVGHAGLETVLGEFQFALSEVAAFLRHGHLVGGGLEVEQRFADVLFDAAPEIGDLIVDALHAAGEFLRLAFAIAVEDCEVDLPLDEADAAHVADAAAEAAVIAVDAELRVIAGAVGTLLLRESLALAGER